MIRRIRKLVTLLRTPWGLVAATLALVASLFVASRQYKFLLHTTALGYALGNRPYQVNYGANALRAPIYVFAESTGATLSSGYYNTAPPNVRDAINAPHDHPNTTAVYIAWTPHLADGHGFVLPCYEQSGAEFSTFGSLSAPQRDLLRRAAPEIEQLMNNDNPRSTQYRFSPELGVVVDTTTLLPTAITLDTLAATSASAFLVSLSGIPWYPAQRRTRRLSQNLCPTCGYDWSAAPGPCPECNTHRTQSPRHTEPTTLPH